MSENYDPQPNKITDEERDFLRGIRGSVFDILNGADPVHGEMARRVSDVLSSIKSAVPSRTERLALLSELLRQIRDEREATLIEVIDSLQYGPVWNDVDSERPWKGEGWSGLGIDTHVVNWLADCAGVTPATIRSREQKRWREKIDAATKARGG